VDVVGPRRSGRHEKELLRERIATGECVLFIGPNTSVLPSRAELAQQLIDYRGSNSPNGLSFPWAAQCHELKYGRESLVSFMEEKIGRVREPPACYRTIAALPFRLILTTNYDTLLEKVFEEEGVAYQTALGIYDLKYGKQSELRIVKPYGCITERDSMVITEKDQFALFDRWPDMLDALETAFSDKVLLFIGCDLTNPDFRHMYRDIASRLNETGQSAYVAQRDASDPLAYYWATQGLIVVEEDAVELLSRAVEYVTVREVGVVEPPEMVYEPLILDDEPLALEVAPWTETGRIRSVNQDYVQVRMPSSAQDSQLGDLFVVADGMGGRSSGEVASQLAADMVVEKYYTDAKGDIPANLTFAIEAANKAICQRADEVPAHRGMGTTAVAAVVREQELYVANVGDSRAYLVHDAEIEQITLDHSWVEEEVQAGRMTPEQAKDHPQRNLLTRVLGVDRRVDVDIFQRELKRGDIVVLCSDGLSEYVEADELREEVSQQPAKLAVKQLAKLANDRGGSDNISVIIVKIS
jgi:serine/threonine protein phosphatase PrpC